MEGIRDVVLVLARDARASCHRLGLVIAGERGWGRRWVQAMLHDLGCRSALWITGEAPEGAWAVPAGKAAGFLGREIEAVVFDAFSGFHADAFGAVSGTLPGGGFLFILAPPLEKWADFPDPDHVRITVPPYTPEQVKGRFLRRLVRVILEDSGLVVLEPGGIVSLPRRSPSVPCPRAARPCRTEDQCRAVEAVVKTALGHRHRPTVLVSDRGRGKSAALGLAAARLLKAGIEDIVVTAPRLEAVEAVFEHAHRQLPAARVSRAALHLGEARMLFKPPDALLHGPKEGRLLLVDEAATIPPHLLERLLERYPRIAFATTVHGYEGTGRGFAVRFQKVLDARAPRWRKVLLKTPIRFAPGDPLERFVFRALLLDAAPAPDAAVGVDVEVERLDRDRLIEDEVVLSELFGLLITAHYRTRPFDLRLLLDAPNVAVYAMRREKHVVATALVAEEGGLGDAMAFGIWAGRTRPHGHLIPESLAAHGGFWEAPPLRCARIMRIAVHPALQGRGLGTRLIHAIAEDARREGFDYLGSSFGATVPLLRFWKRSGFQPVRLSARRGAASGVHSAIVLRPLTEKGRALVQMAGERFQDAFPYQLCETLDDVEPELIAWLMAPSPREGLPDSELGEEERKNRLDWRDAVAFAFGGRAYEASIASLGKLTPCLLPRAGELPQVERNALILKVLQRRSWEETAHILGLTGRKAVIQHLKDAFQTLLWHYGDEEVRALIERLR